jgi:LysM repeat protein
MSDPKDDDVLDESLEFEEVDESLDGEFVKEESKQRENDNLDRAQELVLIETVKAEADLKRRQNELLLKRQALIMYGSAGALGMTFLLILTIAIKSFLFDGANEPSPVLTYPVSEQAFVTPPNAVVKSNEIMLPNEGAVSPRNGGVVSSVPPIAVQADRATGNGTRSSIATPDRESKRIANAALLRMLASSDIGETVSAPSATLSTQPANKATSDRPFIDKGAASVQVIPDTQVMAVDVTDKAQVLTGGATKPHRSSSPSLEYTVEYGDTLLGIAINYGLNFERFAAVNNIPAPYRMSVGQRLVLKDDVVLEFKPVATAEVTTAPVTIDLPERVQYQPENKAQLQTVKERTESGYVIFAVSGSSVYVFDRVEEKTVEARVQRVLPRCGRVLRVSSSKDRVITENCLDISPGAV